MRNCSSLLQWTSEQWVTWVSVNGAITKAVIDTGGEKSMMDFTTAERLELRYLRAKGPEFGKYISPGNVVSSYYGLVRGPVLLQFDE